jgi:transposase InsO family protein
MQQATTGQQHPNASLTPRGRLGMALVVVDEGWSATATAERFQVDPKTVRKWVARYRAEGAAGLQDRSSRPRRSPQRVSRRKRRQVCRVRRQYRRGPARIAAEVGLSSSTVHRILVGAGLNRLDRGDRATNREPVRRYQKDRPGELVHVDVKKLARIPDGGGWRAHGWGNVARRHGTGYTFLHSAIDDRTRLVYTETHNDEKGETAAGFWCRAVAWYQTRGVIVERVLTDNGGCYRSGAWAEACANTGVRHSRTRPYRPQTNGKVERFHRILVEEWAYIRPWRSETERLEGLAGFLHFYNQHRSHGSLNWQPPTTALSQLLKDNVPAQHT